jgi:lipopolysaccharide/colanic/teichoic acid biosynthesis glycosyltransferase
MNRAAKTFASDAGRAAARPQDTGRITDFRTLRLRLYAVIAIADGFAMLAAFLLADLLRFGQAQGYGLTTFMVMFPIYLAVGLNGDAWSINALRSPRHSAGSATRALMFAIAVATVVFFTLKIGEDFSRIVFGIGSGFALLLIAGGRLILGRSFGEHYGWSFRREVLLIDGMNAEPEAGEIVFDAGAEQLQPSLDDPQMLDRLGRILQGSERAIVACPPERRLAWSRALAGANVDAEILTPELASIGALGLRRHGAVPTLLVGHGPLALRDRAIKRLFDIGISGTALILLLPVLAAIAIAIRAESPGPVLFRQPRLGRGNRLFSILKFRSMRSDAADAAGSRSTSRGDERVTRVGRFIRGTSLDELPQLINVLKGEMSLVGPRPHPLGCRAEDQLFWAIDEHYFDRHAIKPGMTGLAQVRGFRGATHKLSDVTDRLRADLEYLDGWHIGRDIGIMLRTLGVLVHSRAY